MKNIWVDWDLSGAALSGRMIIADAFRGFHPRLFTLFAFGEQPCVRLAVSSHLFARFSSIFFILHLRVE